RHAGHRPAGVSPPLTAQEKAGRVLISGEITAMIGSAVKRFCRRLDGVPRGSSQSLRSGARRCAGAGRTMNDQSSADRRNEMSAADVLLGALRAHGIEHFLANPGTDFPSIIEGFARAGESGAAVPRPLLITHENTAVSMAHGAYMQTGKPQAVMVHTNVGTGNTLNTLINASRDNVPLLLLAGRSPIRESGAHGARNRYIHWAQEMFDQAGMVRELVKWDYELRSPDQVEDVVARALEVAMAPPRGPVYLTLPREVLAAAAATARRGARRGPTPAAHPDPEAIATLADWLAAAQRPLIITATAGRTAAGAAALAQL